MIGSFPISHIFRLLYRRHFQNHIKSPIQTTLSNYYEPSMQNNATQIAERGIAAIQSAENTQALDLIKAHYLGTNAKPVFRLPTMPSAPLLLPPSCSKNSPPKRWT